MNNLMDLFSHKSYKEALKKSYICLWLQVRIDNNGKNLIVKIENFAIDQGCDCMELIARPGWQKILDKHNYFRTHVVLEKNLKQKEK